VAREEVRRGEAKMLRGKQGRMVRLVARLLSEELKRGKTFRKKARRGQESKGIVTMSVLMSCMGHMDTTLSPTLDAKRCPLSTFK